MQHADYLSVPKIHEIGQRYEIQGTKMEMRFDSSNARFCHDVHKQSGSLCSVRPVRKKEGGGDTL